MSFIKHDINVTTNDDEDAAFLATFDPASDHIASTA